MHTCVLSHALHTNPACMFAHYSLLLLQVVAVHCQQTAFVCRQLKQHHGSECIDALVRAMRDAVRAQQADDAAQQLSDAFVRKCLRLEQL